MSATLLEKRFAEGFTAGKSWGDKVSTYQDGDEGRYAKVECATLPVLYWNPGEAGRVEAIRWRCGFMIGFLTVIVDREL